MCKITHTRALEWKLNPLCSSQSKVNIVLTFWFTKTCPFRHLIFTQTNALFRVVGGASWVQSEIKMNKHCLFLFRNSTSYLDDTDSMITQCKLLFTITHGKDDTDSIKRWWFQAFRDLQISTRVLQKQFRNNIKEKMQQNSRNRNYPPWIDYERNFIHLSNFHINKRLFLHGFRANIVFKTKHISLSCKLTPTHLLRASFHTLYFSNCN